MRVLLIGAAVLLSGCAGMHQAHVSDMKSQCADYGIPDNTAAMSQCMLEIDKRQQQATQDWIDGQSRQTAARNAAAQRQACQTNGGTNC